MAAGIDDLIAEATAIVDRRGGDVVVLALVRDELAAAVLTCQDGPAAADACDVLGAVERALRAADGDLALAS